jgi:hypothetical protein
MLVACCDHAFGISTPRCSKTTLPFSLPMIASRSSHSTSSNGSMPAVVKKRGNSSPGALAVLRLVRGASLVVVSVYPPADWPAAAAAIF